ncbi:unnamed protein product [Symbiodinium natans]|uniref:Uncharacterized protein n=1 Tax=Symbiodinium natans TaxID=878477 RepID=A0A812JB61_9DINO|nr:unnamed protein product [Symbiodinium natans]
MAELTKALQSNTTLRRLDVQARFLALQRDSAVANYLEPEDLKAIFDSLAPSSALQDLRVNFQASLKASPPVDFAQMMRGKAGTEIYKAAAEALRANRQLLKLDLILVQRHWQDQICRGLMQNLEEKRKGGRACEEGVMHLHRLA